MVLVNLIEKKYHCIVYLVKPLAKNMNEVTTEEPFGIYLLKCAAYLF